MENPQLQEKELPFDIALAHSIFKRIKQYTSSEDGAEYCIVDRANSDAFVSVFKDSVNSYRNDIVICERLYFKDKCGTTTKPVLEASDEAKALYAEFIEFADSMGNVEELSDEKRDSLQAKLEEYKVQLEREDMKPKVIDTEVPCYKNDYNGDGYMVIPVKDIPDENLMSICEVIARFTIAYFTSTRLIFNGDIMIHTFPVNYEDHIDIVAMLEVKNE